MSVKQIPHPFRPLISMEKGQNYWLNGCVDFLMECLGEDEAYDYWFFSGVTGDSFLQMYSKNPEITTLCFSGSFSDAALEKAFGACGYNYEYASDISGNQMAYEQKIREYIDRGVPVIARLCDTFRSFAVICGYDENGAYCITGEDATPQPCDFDELVFVTDKTGRPSLADMYREVVTGIPSLITAPETAEFSFGKRAFTQWAESFQSSLFDSYSLDDRLWYSHPAPSFSCWNMHGTYLCILGTNNCAIGFLTKALELNPDMAFIDRLLPLYKKLCQDGFRELIAMEGGFSLKPEVLKDRERMKPVSDKILVLAKYCDEILEVFF